jgi:hypothetical protein
MQGACDDDEKAFDDKLNTAETLSTYLHVYPLAIMNVTKGVSDEFLQLTISHGVQQAVFDGQPLEPPVMFRRLRVRTIMRIARWLKVPIDVQFTFFNELKNVAKTSGCSAGPK